MFFLIEYDRTSSQLVSMRTFERDEHAEAERIRLEREIALNRIGVRREIVVLESDSEQELRMTHRRYFETLRELSAFPADAA